MLHAQCLVVSTLIASRDYSVLHRRQAAGLESSCDRSPALRPHHDGGRSAHWFRNAMGDPGVELLLPGALIAVRLGPFDPGGIGRRINSALWVFLGAAGIADAVSRRKSRLTRAATARRSAAG
jgi:hypothetical protein